MRLVYWLLVVHGIVCLLGAFFPFYPPVFLFYWFFPGHFAIKLIIVLLVGAFQVVYGGYLLLKRRWHVRWYWLALSVFVFAGLLLIFPALHPPGLFTGLLGETSAEPPYPSARPGAERPDDIIPTPGGPQYRANVHQEGVENPWPPIETKEESLDENVICIYRTYIETKAGEARNNIIRVVTPGGDIRSLSLHASNIPNGIEVKQGMEWHGPHSVAQVLIMEISQDIEPGQYTLEISVEIDGKSYGKVPCTIKVTSETTPTSAPQPIPQQPAELPLRITSVTSPVRPLANVTLVAETLPEAECYITIDYGPSGVQSLRPKIADGSGKVSWTWTVGNFRGIWEIVVKASYGGETVSRYTLLTIQ